MALAHVVAEDSGAGFIPQPEQQIFFDDTAGCLHLVEGRMISSVPLPEPRVAPGRGDPVAGAAAGAGAGAAGGAGSGYESDGSSDSSTSTSSHAFLVSEGPPVRLIRSSPEGLHTALWRSASLVEMHSHVSGNLWVETPGDKQG